MPDYIQETEKANSDWSRYFKLPEDLTVTEWCEKYVRQASSPFGDRFKPTLTPWVREPLDTISDPAIRELTVKCSVQGGKTQLLQNTVMYALANDPGPMFVTCQTDADALDLARTRLNPMSERTKPVGEKLKNLSRTEKTLTQIHLVDSWVMIHGASESNLASKSVRWILNDEIWKWKPGLLDQARDRGTMFWNRKIVNASTAGSRGSDIEDAFELGTQHRWHLWCPSCKTNFDPDFYETIIWDKTLVTPNGVDWTKLKDSVRMVCPNCKVEHVQTETLWRQMTQNGRYVQSNDTPAPGHASYTWNCLTLSPSTFSWGDAVVQFVKAYQAYDRGSSVLLKEFKLKRLAEPWDETVSFSKSITNPSSDYALGDVWDHETIRFMAADVQKDHLWYVCRAFSDDGSSRLVSCGKLLDFDELEAKRQEMCVETSHLFVDLSFRTPEVKMHAAKYGWRLMRGDNREGFPWIQNDGTAVIREYSKPAKMDATIGKGGRARPVIYLSWSNPLIKDRLLRLQSGKSSIYYGIPIDAPDFYIKQMDSEQKIPKTNKTTGKIKYEWVTRDTRSGEHCRDCECMILVGAMIKGVLQDGSFDLDTGEND